MSSRPPRFERTLERQVGVINPEAGAAEFTLARELEAFSARRQAELDQRADEESELAGQLAAMEGGQPLDRERTIRQRAFNRGVRIVHQAAVQTDIRDSIARLELEHPTDPDTFRAHVEGLEEGLLAEADSHLRPFIQQRIRDYAGRAEIGIIARQQDELRAQAVSDLKRGVEGFFEDATTAAFEGDVLLIEARREELESLLNEAFEAGLLGEADVADTHRSFERAITQQEVVGNFSRLIQDQGSEAGIEAIGRWQRTRPSEVGITADEHENVTRQLVTLRNRQAALEADERAREDAAERAERDFRRGRVQDAIRVLERGFVPDKEQAEAVAGDLEWLEDPALALKFDVAGAIQSQVHRFRRLPEPQRAAELTTLERDLRGEGATVEQLELLRALQQTDAEVTRELEQDPRGYVIREGLMADGELDFSSAESFIASIEARADNTGLGRQLTGEPIPRLTAAEADQLAQVYAQAEIEERAGILGALTAGAGEDAQATLAQLDTQGHADMALLGGMVMQGQGQLAREIMRGQAVLAATPDVRPARTDYSADVENIWGEAMTDWPEQRAVYLQAAFAKYAELKQRTGDLSEIYESRLMAQALRAVLPTGRFNGRRVALPAGISDRDFNTWVRQWHPVDFEGIAGAGTPEEALQLVRRRGRLIEAGHGRYAVAIESAIDAVEKPLVREDGSVFVLDMAQMAERPSPPPPVIERGLAPGGMMP